MTVSKPSGYFEDDARWDRAHGTVDFTLVFHTDDGRQDITCRVSREALEDRAKTSREIKPLLLFKRFKREIERAVDTKLKLGTFEADGLILIKSGEI